MLVELPDTASGSEKSPWYPSTRIVPCFKSRLILLAASNKTKKTPWRKSRFHPCQKAKPIPIIYDNPLSLWELDRRPALNKIRHMQVHKARALKKFLHLFNTYGINRRARYLLMIRLSFVSPNCPKLYHKRFSKTRRRPVTARKTGLLK